MKCLVIMVGLLLLPGCLEKDEEVNWTSMSAEEITEDILARAYIARYTLDVSWEKVLDTRKAYPVLVNEAGPFGYVQYGQQIAGKTCDATFKYGDAGQGEWDFDCADGTKAAGTFHIQAGKDAKGTGFDMDGNKIEFLMLRAPAKS